MENENEKENKVRSVDLFNTQLTVRSLGAIGALILATLGAVAGAFVFIDEHYVDQDVYEAHVTTNAKDMQKLDQKTAKALEAVQDLNQQEFNRVYKAIKDGTALPLIVRRDILLARGDNLSPEERAELTILETKLDELNID